MLIMMTMVAAMLVMVVLVVVIVSMAIIMGTPGSRHVRANEPGTFASSEPSIALTFAGRWWSRGSEPAASLENPEPQSGWIGVHPGLARVT